MRVAALSSLLQIRSNDERYSQLKVPDMRITIVENDRQFVEKAVTVWGDSLSPFSPYGAVVLTVPVQAVAETTVIRVSEAEPRPAVGSAAPPKVGTRPKKKKKKKNLPVPLAETCVDIMCSRLRNRDTCVWISNYIKSFACNISDDRKN